MDWRYNTIWFEQINYEKYINWDFKERSKDFLNLETIEYAILWHYKQNGIAFELSPDSKSLLYLEMNWANIKDFDRISKYDKLKRLELHYCTKLENDYGISSLKDTLEFLHINTSKKLKVSEELFELKKLKVLRLNSCGEIENLDFLKNFPNLIDFRFSGTTVKNGDLSPILKHPTIKNIGFNDKRHYNLKSTEILKELNNKNPEGYLDYAYKGEFKTFKIKNYE